MEEKIIFTTREAARYLGISLSTIYRMEKQGLISAIRTPGGQRRFSKKNLERYLKESQNFEAPQNPSKYKKQNFRVKETGNDYALKNNQEISMTMTIGEIKNELKKIYKERKSWNGAKDPFTESEIRQRELVLIKQQLLYRIKDAKLFKDKVEESFNFTLYKLIYDYLKDLKEK